MSEWWTYGLSDFLMFSPDAYWRLVARHNAAWWPAQLLGVAAGAGLLVLLRQGTRWASRAGLVLLALAWTWVGWAFHARSYAEIFLGAPWLAAVCGVQSLMLLVAAAGKLDACTARARLPAIVGRLGIAAALLYPLETILQGREWAQAEVFGFMPDPTALATLGALLALPHLRTAARVLLAVVPVLSLLLGAATRWLLA